MVSYWRLSDSKSPQVFRTLFSIMDVLHNAIVWLVPTCPLIFKSSNLSSNSSVTVLSAPITIGITITFLFYSFSLLYQGLRTYLSFYFLSVLPYGHPERKIHNSAGSFFVWSRLGDPLLSQNSREVCASHFPIWILCCAYAI